MMMDCNIESDERRPPVCGPEPTTKTRVRVSDPTSESGWDALLTSHPGAGFFHSAAWARVLQGSYGFPCHYLTIEQAGRLLALLPLMEAGGFPTRRRGVSLPFTDECEPLTGDPSCRSLEMLGEMAMQHGRSRCWRYLECRGSPSVFREAPESIAFHGHRLDLEADEDRLFSRVEGSVRRAIRKSARLDLRVEFRRDRVAVQHFFRLHCVTRQRQGVPPQPFSFFESIRKHVFDAGLGFIAIAVQGNKPVAAAVFFHFGCRAIFKFGASDDLGRELRGNNLVLWESVRHLRKIGCRQLSFGRTSLCNEGLRRFKQSWGSVEYRISYFRFDMARRRFLRCPDRAEGWCNRIFRLLPMPALRIVGAVAYQHMA